MCALTNRQGAPLPISVPPNGNHLLFQLDGVLGAGGLLVLAGADHLALEHLLLNLLRCQLIKYPQLTKRLLEV